MSTLPGLASKGEKGKSKFQSLDINSLYRGTLGESVEKQQQKNTLTHRHGMQILGKVVPNTRRPPANLPSLKSEHSGTDTAVSLVPSNGSGWGKQESTSSSTTTSTTSVSNSSTSVTNTSGTPQLSAHQAAIALPVTTTIPPPSSKPHSNSATPATGDKSWSSVMSGNDPAAHPPPYQSPQFQHEFPSLSAGDGVPSRTGTDTQYGPGPSLRPQTEGSWLQGGSRVEGATQRSNSVPHNVPPQLSAPGGPQVAPQYRAFVPPFMCRGSNFQTNGHGGSISNIPGQPQAQPSLNRGSSNNVTSNNRSDQNRAGSRDHDELAHRPIIKEEELHGMDNLTSDMGWAMHDDIDYNQKLAFSDDESKPDKDRRKSRAKEYEKTDNLHQDLDHKSWANVRTVSTQQQQSPQSQQQPLSRRLEDEELQRRKQQQTKAIAVERAKQRKDEEEKKYEKTKQEAAKKLKELDEKIDKRKRDKECDETTGTIHPASVPAQTVTTVPIPLPEWEREPKLKSSTLSQESVEESKPPAIKPAISRVENSQSDFRQLTQIEGRGTFTRKGGRGPEKDQTSHTSFSWQFQIPPRFKKQMNSTSQSNGSFPYENIRWNQGSNNKTSPNNRKPRDLDNKEREEERFRRHQTDDYRGHCSYSESGRKSSADNRYDDYRSDLDFKKDKEEDKKVRQENKLDSMDNLSRQNSDEWHGDRRIDRYGDRPPRPDSRDSRTSRESRHSVDSTRHSEPRDYIGAWPESHFEDGYEEKKKEHRMPQVPGPITKEKIEADDLRNEKRNLTQLKRGNIPDKRLEKDLIVEKIEDDSWNLKRNKEGIDGSRAWADAISPCTTPLENSKFIELDKKSESIKSDDLDEKKDKDEKRSNRGRSDSQGSRNQGWGGSNNSVVYRSSSSWSKKGGGGNSGRGSRGTVPSRPPSSKSGEWHGTESESSADDGSLMSENTLHRSPKTVKKFDKDEKNKELKNDKSGIVEKKGDKPHRDFVPRGEPSRHGRGGASGGGSSFRGGRGGCKRIDGYGPPPVKSPFSSYHEEKDKKVDLECTDSNTDDKCRTKEIKMDDRNKKKDKRKPKVEGEVSDNSDDASKDKRKIASKPMNRQPPNQQRRNNPMQTSRIVNDKRTNFGGPSRNDPPNRQNSSGSLRLSQNKDTIKEKDTLCNAISDISLKNKDEPDNIEVDIETPPSDDGFQEVKSKKTEKRPKPDDKPNSKPQVPKVDKDIKSKPKPNAQLSQQQIANIPSLMSMPINPPVNLPQPQQNKAQFERTRQNKLPPRLVKQRENNRLHKAQLQQGMCDVNDINKVSQNMFMKDNGQVQSSITNAWEKPLAQLRGNMESSDVMSISIDSNKVIEQQVNSGVTNEDKVLDGSKPLNTIIFENTNYKSAPGPRGRNDKGRPDVMIDGSTLTNFNKPMGELLVNKNDKQADIQMDLAFGTKEDNVDMKLDFFESEISHLTEEKTTNKNISGLPRTMHAITTSNNTISPSTADALNIKIQSVKKVWEMAPVIENTEDNASFPTSFGPDPNSLDPSAAFNKPTDSQDDTHEGYSPSPSNQNASNSTTNVCKVKPTQQVAGSAGQTVLSAGTHQQHSAMVGPGLMGHTLSPPPQMPVIGGGVGLGQPPQQYTTNQHINYQAGLGGSTQYGMSAIPSPPTVLYNPNQQLQAAQTGLYGAFQIDQSQVLSNQGRSQYSQYSQYGLGQTASSPYSGQSVYLQPAQPHPPPTQAPPDMYPSNYRLPATGPFGQSQQLNNPTTVLISSTSNSLMSATVKPSSQQISAIGTKAGGVGQAYQQQTQQGQQLYMTYDPTIQANYLQNTGVMQRGPNSVMPGLQPSALQASSSYYSGSTGGQTAGYFQQPGSSTLQSAQMSQHQAGYGLQGSVFGTHNQSHTSPGMQNFGSHFLSGQIQLAAMSQQFRSANLPNTYMKSVGNQQMNDQSSRSQQLKSPGGQQEVLSSVFNSASQIPSPKSRQTCKQPPPQPSPTSQNKYLYQNVQSQQQSGQNRYPAPIQRPIGNPYPLGASMPNNGNQKHRANNVNNRAAPRQYYGGQGGNLNNQGDKSDESKLGENVPNSTNNSSSAKTAVTSVNQSTDKGDIGKDENSAISKD